MFTTPARVLFVILRRLKDVAWPSEAVVMVSFSRSCVRQGLCSTLPLVTINTGLGVDLYPGIRMLSLFFFYIA